MLEAVVDKIKRYAESKNLDGSIYLIGNSAEKGRGGDIDLLLVLNGPYEERLETQKELIDVLNEEEIFDYSLLKNTLRSERQKVHVLFYYTDGAYNDNPVFTKSYFANGFKLIYGRDISKELIEYLENKITPRDYIDYIDQEALFKLSELILSANGYPEPEKEIEERLKFIRKTIRVIEKDLGHKFEFHDAKGLDFAIKAEKFLSEVQKRIQVDNFLEIREIRAEDLPKIKAYFNFYLEKYPYIPRKNPISDEELETWKNDLEKGKSYGMVAELDGEIIGSCALNRIAINGFYRISSTFVPEYQSMNIGKSLVESAIKLAKEHGVKKIISKIHFNNNPANKILEKNEFVNLTVSEERPDYYDEIAEFYRTTFGEDESYHIWELDLGEKHE